MSERRSSTICAIVAIVAMTLSEQVIVSIIYGSRSEISVVAFCTSPPIGGLSAFLVVGLFVPIYVLYLLRTTTTTTPADGPYMAIGHNATGPFA